MRKLLLLVAAVTISVVSFTACAGPDPHADLVPYPSGCYRIHPDVTNEAHTRWSHQGWAYFSDSHYWYALTAQQVSDLAPGHVTGTPLVIAGEVPKEVVENSVPYDGTNASRGQLFVGMSLDVNGAIWQAPQTQDHWGCAVSGGVED